MGLGRWAGIATGWIYRVHPAVRLACRRWSGHHEAAYLSLAGKAGGRPQSWRGAAGRGGPLAAGHQMPNAAAQSGCGWRGRRRLGRWIVGLEFGLVAVARELGDIPPELFPLYIFLTRGRMKRNTFSLFAGSAGGKSPIQVMRVPGRQGIIASKFDGGDGFGFFKEAVQDFQGATA